MQTGKSVRQKQLPVSTPGQFGLKFLPNLSINVFFLSKFLHLIDDLINSQDLWTNSFSNFAAFWPQWRIRLELINQSAADDDVRHEIARIADWHLTSWSHTFSKSNLTSGLDCKSCNESSQRFLSICANFRPSGNSWLTLTSCVIFLVLQPFTQFPTNKSIPFFSLMRFIMGTMPGDRIPRLDWHKITLPVLLPFPQVSIRIRISINANDITYNVSYHTWHPPCIIWLYKNKTEIKQTKKHKWSIWRIKQMDWTEISEIFCDCSE